MFAFLVVCNLLIPVSMIGFGYAFHKSPPGEINWAFGYRTKMSMKNKDTWETAHFYMGRIWFYSGLCLAVVSIAALLAIRGRDNFEDLSLYVTGFQMIILIMPIPFTEAKLKKLFGKNGRRRIQRAGKAE